MNNYFMKPEYQVLFLKKKIIGILKEIFGINRE